MGYFKKRNIYWFMVNNCCGNSTISFGIASDVSLFAGEKVFKKPNVEKMMRNDFILVSLYVDERTKLPAVQQLVYKAKNGNDKSIITIGDKWSAFQVDNFDATSQPQYAIISPEENALVKT